MAFLSRYQHDGFLSYAHTEVLNDWSHDLAAQLEKTLDLAFGLERGSFNIWTDKATEGNYPLTDNLKQKLETSAFILVVLTEKYLRSPWCNNELKWFNQTILSKEKDLSKPVFLVRVHEIARKSWPSELKILDLPGYDFVGDKELKWPVGFPKNEKDRGNDYNEAFGRLAKDIVGHVKRITKNEAKEVEIPLQPQLEPTGAAKPRLFLAAVPEDSRALRAEAVTHLSQFFDVVPADNPRSPAKLVDQVADWIRNCALFADVLGASSGVWETDDDGFVLHQIRQAEALGLPVHHFVSPKLISLDDVESGPYRTFLDSLAPFRVESVSRFAARVGSLRPEKRQNEPSVYLIPDGDRELESRVRQVLSTLAVKTRPLPREDSAIAGLGSRDLRSLDYDSTLTRFIDLGSAVIVLNGARKKPDPEWVDHTSLRLLQYAPAGRKLRLAIVDGPPAPRLSRDTPAHEPPVFYPDDQDELKHSLQRWLAA